MFCDKKLNGIKYVKGILQEENKEDLDFIAFGIEDQTHIILY